MPWVIQKQNDQFCVHRKNDDGSAGALVPGGCHEDENGAERHMRALYANVAEMSYSESLLDTPHQDTSMLPQTPACIDDLVKAFKAEGMDDATAMARAVEQCQAQEHIGEMTTTAEGDVEPINELSTNDGQDDDPELVTIAEIGLSTRMSRDERVNIPFAPGLKAEDFVGTDGGVPTFIELKIAEIGRRSQEGIYYDEPLVDSIVEQINRKRVGGIFGHTDPNHPYETPDPEVMWVGATRIGNIAYAKGWVREMKTERRVQDIKRVGGTIGTSIWGRGAKLLQDNAIRLKKFILGRLDLTDDVEQASLQMDGRFALVHEMTGSGTEDNKPVTPEELKAELANHPADVIINLLPPTTYERVVEMVASRNSVLAQAGEQQIISELTAENNAANTLIAEMQATAKTNGETITRLQGELLQHDLDATVRWATDWTVTTEAGRTKLSALRSYLKKGLIAEMKADEPLKEAMNRVMDSQEFKPVIEMTKNAIGGGALVGVTDSSRQSEQYARPTQEQIDDAQARTGIR